MRTILFVFALASGMCPISIEGSPDTRDTVADQQAAQQVVVLIVKGMT